MSLLRTLSTASAVWLALPSLLAAQDAAEPYEEDLEIVAAPSGEGEEEEEEVELVVTADDGDAAPPQDEVALLRAQVAALEARLSALEGAESESVTESGSASESASESGSGTDSVTGGDGDLVALLARGLRLTGYVQAQYEWSALSEDQLLQGGESLNHDRFVIRRGRLRLSGRWDFVEADFEIDASTTRGLSVSVRRASLGLALREQPDATPLVRVRAGLTEIPFGHELRVSQRDLPFMERSTGSLAFFRGPVDVGARLDGQLGVFTYDLMVMSGTPLDDRAGASSLDPTAAPDLVGRLGVDLAPLPSLRIAAGASFLWGTGFSPGRDASENRLEWRDLNESGTLDSGELVAVPGRAALPSSTFTRWAFGADLLLDVTSPLGATLLFGEVVIAQNLDRAFFVADPVVSGAPVRELSAYAALAHTFLDWGLVGFRYDLYDPNSDLFEQRRGVAVPGDASLHTLSPMLGVRLPEGFVDGFEGRLVAQYDVVFDALGRDVRGVPTDLSNDRFTVRVQGAF